MILAPRRQTPVGDPGPLKPADLILGAGQLIEPLISIDELVRILNCSRRWLERERSAGRAPRPDFMAGRCPRWKLETVRRWIEGGGRP
jgi:hypothetical protein